MCYKFLRGVFSHHAFQKTAGGSHTRACRHKRKNRFLASSMAVTFKTTTATRARLCLPLLLARLCLPQLARLFLASDVAMPQSGQAERILVPKPWGKEWGLDATESNRIFRETGVKVGIRKRPQWGDTWWLTANGPAQEWDRAQQMAKD